MRNGKHYVPVRMTKSEKDKFLRFSTLCRAPEKTVLYWLVNGMIVNEKPPKIFFKITSLLLRLQTNVDHIWLGHNNLSKQLNTNITGFQRSLMTAIAKSLSKDYSQKHTTVKTTSNNIERQ